MKGSPVCSTCRPVCDTLPIPSTRGAGPRRRMTSCLRLHISRLSLLLKFFKLSSKISFTQARRLNFSRVPLPEVGNYLLMLLLRTKVQLLMSLFGLMLCLLHR